LAASNRYRTSFEILQKARQKLGYEPAQNTLALVTLDFRSEGQARFRNALIRLNILVEAVDFRNATVTMPLGGDGEQKDRRITSLAP
jgi:hypothetical protein